jgi:hypothetical protein
MDPRARRAQLQPRGDGNTMTLATTRGRSHSCHEYRLYQIAIASADLVLGRAGADAARRMRRSRDEPRASRNRSRRVANSFRAARFSRRYSYRS